MEQKRKAAERTKANLIQAFWNCYENTPLSEITVKNIMQTAGYNRSTFYQYFDDIKDLCQQAEDGLIMNLNRIIDETIDSEISEHSTEAMLERFIFEYGKELKISLVTRLDPYFLEHLKKSVATPYINKKFLCASELNRELLCEFGSANFISSIAYMCKHLMLTENRSFTSFVFIITAAQMNCQSVGHDAINYSANIGWQKKRVTLCFGEYRSFGKPVHYLMGRCNFIPETERVPASPDREQEEYPCQQ